MPTTPPNSKEHLPPRQPNPQIQETPRFQATSPSSKNAPEATPQFHGLSPAKSGNSIINSGSQIKNVPNGVPINTGHSIPIQSGYPSNVHPLPPHGHPISFMHNNAPPVSIPFYGNSPKNNYRPPSNYIPSPPPPTVTTIPQSSYQYAQPQPHRILTNQSGLEGQRFRPFENMSSRPMPVPFTEKVV